MVRAVWECLFDSANDGFTTPTVEAGSPARVAGQYANFLSCAVRSAATADRVQLLKSKFLASTSVFAFVFALDFDGDHTVATDRTLLDITEDANNWIRVYFRASDDKFVLEIRSGGLTESVATAAQTWTAGDGLVIACYATASALGIAISKSLAAIAGYTTAARAQAAPVLTDTTIDIGRREDGTLYSEAAFAYVAAFTTAPIAEAASGYATTARPPLFGERIGRDMAALWYGKDSGYFETANDILSCDAREFTHRSGRDYPSTRGGRASAGTFSARLKNVDGRYSPSNTASPLTGKLLPNRSLRLRGADATQHYSRWQGFLASAPKPQHSSGRRFEAMIDAVGPFQALKDKTVRLAGASSVLTGTQVGAVLDDAGWPSADRDVDAGQETMGIHFVDGVRALTALQDLEDTEGPGAFLHESNDGQVVFEDRHSRLTAIRSTQSQMTITDNTGDAIVLADGEEEDPLAEIYNEVIVTVHPVGSAGATAALWVYSGPSLTIAPGESTTIFATFPNPNRPAGAYVSSWKDIIAGDITVSGAAFADLAFSYSKLARTDIVEITNTHATLTATISALQVRGDPVDFGTPVAVQAVSATSQDVYGQRSWPLAPKWLSNVLTAQDFADANLSRYKDPVPLVKVKMYPEWTAACMAACLALELSDRITVDADMPEFGLDAAEMYVEAIAETVVAETGEHTINLELSSAAGDGGFWTLGVSTLGVSTKLAY